MLASALQTRNARKRCVCGLARMFCVAIAKPPRRRATDFLLLCCARTAFKRKARKQTPTGATKIYKGAIRTEEHSNAPLLWDNQAVEGQAVLLKQGYGAIATASDCKPEGWEFEPPCPFHASAWFAASRARGRGQDIWRKSVRSKRGRSERISRGLVAAR